MYNDQKFLDLRKKLRKNQTNAETILWNALRNNALGFKFRRQYSVGRNILDFYAPSIRLNIELDGKVHDTQKEYDVFRDDFLKGLDIKTLRFTNEEITNSLTEVLAKIKSVI